MVLSPSPVAKPSGSETASRPLAYEQAISQARESASAEPDDSKTKIPPFETVTSQPEPQASAPEGAETPQDMSQDMASLPDESADANPDGTPDEPSQDMAALPGENPAPYDDEVPPPIPGEAGQSADQGGTDGAEQWGDERGEPWAYGRRPDQADPYGPPDQADPYGAPDQADQYGDEDPTEWADQNTEEWVEVIISGAAMRSSASEDAPMLFAFPYGRSLKVVSRYEGWVQVTDPQSAATGWMQAHYLAPSAAARQTLGQDEAYYDEPPGRRRRGWFRRNGGGGLADIINRAFGGGF